MSTVVTADFIPGWMTHAELDWLAQQASLHQNIVELGSFRGRSTMAICDNAAGKVTAIDTWCTLPFVINDDGESIYREFR
jgi:hypothetical protein